jgi:hypothetical protein
VIAPLRCCFVLACFAAWSALGCGRGQDRASGYRFSPDEESGSVTFVAASGEAEEHALGDDCGVFLWEILLGKPPEYNVGWEPILTCPEANVPALYLYDPSDRTTTLDWPEASGQLAGAVWVGPDDFSPVELDVTIEASEGELLDPPAEGEPPPRVDDPATTPDYAHRFRVRAEFTCAEVGLECDGTWIYDMTFNLSADSVTWFFPE